MKKYIFSLLIIAVAACAKTEPQDALNTEIALPEGPLVLVGEASDYEDADADAKVSVVTKDASGYPCVWNAGDEVGARLADGTVVGKATLASGAGCKSANFNFAVSKAQAEGTDIRLIYPYSRLIGFTTSTLASEQVQTGFLDGNNNISAYDFAYADIKYSSSMPGTFKIKHILSYLCLHLSSPQFAGTTLNSVKISCTGASLSGTYGVNYNTLAVTPKTGKDYVKVTFKTPVVLGENPIDIWFTLLPVDLSGKTVTLTFNITTPWETLETTSTLDGIKLEPGKAFTVNRLKYDPVPGYCPVDSRKFVGEGHAYGQANTFILQCKDGSVYKGATYQPVDDYSRDVIIDYRVRGQRSTAKLPTNVKFGWATVGYGVTQKVSEAYTPRTAEYPNSGVSLEDGSWSYVVNRDNFTVRVINMHSEAGAPILLMLDAGTNEIIWGWSFWNIAADGTKLEAETIDGAWWMANMDIGQPTTDIAAWCANTSSSGNPDPIWRMVHKYQWGRYLPVFWQTYWSINVKDSSYKGNIPAVVGPVSMENSLKTPYGLVVPSVSAGSVMSEWLSTPDGSLWGNLNSDIKAEGMKTIYDPCPKGWRMPDYRHFYPRRFTESWTVYGETHPGYPGWAGSKALINGSAASSYYVAGGYIENKVSSVSGTTAMMSVMGCRTNGTGASALWWASNCQLDSDTNPCYFGTNTGGNTPAANPGLNDPGNSASKPVKKASAGAVRCAWDLYNR